MTPQRWEWTDPAFSISTDFSLLDIEAVRAAFASPMLWWAKPWADAEAFEQMLRGSLCFGVYHRLEDSTRMVGFARLITDHHTFGFLTDLYIIEEYQGRGLARWLMMTMDGVMETWPMARRMLYVADKEVAKNFYAKLDGMEEVNMEGSHTYMQKVYKGFPEHH